MSDQAAHAKPGFAQNIHMEGWAYVPESWGFIQPARPAMTKPMKTIHRKKRAGRDAVGAGRKSPAPVVRKDGVCRDPHLTGLEAVARLSRGLSHELGNVLTIALGNISLVRAHLNDVEARSMVDDALGAIEQAVCISGKLGDIGIEDGFNPVPVDLAAFVERYAVSASRIVGEAVSIVVRSQAVAGPALADARYLELALNAVLGALLEAADMPATLVIELIPVECAAKAPEPRRAVSICIHDGRDSPLEGTSSRGEREAAPSANDRPWPGIGMWFARQVAMASGGDLIAVTGKRGHPCVCIKLPCV